MPQEPNAPETGAPANGETPQAPTITADLQKIIDERIAEATKKANAEAAAHRHKLKEIEEAAKKAEEAKLAEQGEYKKLLEAREAELIAEKAKAAELDTYKAKLTAIEARERAALLAKLPEAQRTKFADFTIEQLNAVVETIPPALPASQGNERPPATGQQQAPKTATVPFEGATGGVMDLLKKQLGL